MTSRFSLIFLTFWTYAFGGQSSSAARAESPDACALLSRLEVEEAAGIPVRQGVSRLTNGNLTSCWFAGERPGQVAILVRRFPTPAWTSEQLERMNRAVPFGTYREVAGIGDRAFLYNIQKTGGVLCVFAADYYLQVSLFRRNEEPRIAGLLQKLAASALTQLRAAAKSASSAAN